jgi:hypothetical protein
MTKQNSSLSWRVLSFVGGKFFGARLLKETEGRLWSWNQVFRGVQQDKERSLLFWGFSIVEDGEGDFGGECAL